MSFFAVYPPISGSGGAASHVIVDSSALPTGASTSALQTTGNTSLASIDTKTPALGQALAAASTPVVLTAAQISTLTPLSTVAVTQSTSPWVVSAASLPLPSGAATSALQTTGNSSLSSIDGKIPANLTVTSTRLLVDGSGVTQPVSGTFFQATQPISGTVTANAGSGTFAVSAASLPLPSGAATAAKQPALGIAGTASADVITVQGIASMTALKVDGSAVTQPVSGTVTANAGSGSFTVAQATGTNLHMVVDSGTITAVTSLTNALPVGANVIGKVSIDQTTPGTTNLVALAANQSVNVAQINGVTTLMGNGVTGTGSQRVTIASDNTAFSVNAVQSGTWTVQPGNTANTTAWLTNQSGRLTANTSSYNDYTSVNVTTAAYVQLVASTTSATGEIEIFDSSGQGMILATGAAAAEVDQINIFPGGNGRVQLKIAAGTRVSIKAKTATASVGYIMINYYA